MDYKIDLNPNDFGQQTDALFHYQQSYPLAHGELDGTEWECRLANCGEQKINVKGERIHPAEIDQYYDTDEKLWKAIEDDEVYLDMNSWWEIEFYRVENEHNEYLDLFMALDDTCIVDNPEDAIETFKVLMDDKEFVKDLKLVLKGGTK